MTIRKSIEFFAPYIASTFNRSTNVLAGANGMLGGGEITVLSPATTVTVGPYSFVQNGLIVNQDADTTPVTVPDFSSYTGPVHISLSSPDAKDTSGVTVTVIQGNAGISESTVIAASRINGVWFNPPAMSLKALKDEAAQVRADAGPGPLEGAGVVYSEAFGTNQGVRVIPGLASDSEGSRVVLSPDTSTVTPVAHAELDIDSVDPDFDRVDHVVLRKKNAGRPAELTYVKGETSNSYPLPRSAPTAEVNVVTPVSGTNPCVADNSSGAHVVVWGDGTDLVLRVMAHSPSRTGGFTSSLAMGGTVSHSFITARPNMQATDRMFGLVSAGASGSENIYLFRTDADGANLVSSTSIDALSNSCINGHMVVDENNFAHIVFQHNESGGGVNNQVYYCKYNLDDSAWGTGIAVGPRFARGYNSGQNDTDPRIAIDPDGNLHITFVRATSPAVVGDIVYLVIDQTGATVEAEVTVSASVANGSTGAAATSRTDHAKPRIAATPQGDIYIAYFAEYSVPGDPFLRVFERSLYERIGFRSVEVIQAALGAINHAESIEAFSDDIGRLSVFMLLEDVSNTTAYMTLLKFDPVIVSNGVEILPDIISQFSGIPYCFLQGSFTDGYDDDAAYACHDRDGSIQAVILKSGSVDHYKWSSQPVLGAEGIYTAKKHPKDSYLSTIAHGTGNSNIVTASGKTVATRRRLSGKPVFTAVGLDGDFAGYNGIQEAINSLKGSGGTVVVRGGYYKVSHRIRPYSGIKIVADGSVVFDMCNELSTEAAIYIQGKAGMTPSAVTAAQRSFSFSGATFITSGARPGDLILTYDSAGTVPAYPGSNLSEKAYITGIISETDVYLNRDISSDISGTPLSIWYATGCRFEGIEFYDNRNASGEDMMAVEYAYQSGLKDVIIGATDSTGLRLTANNRFMVDGCEITGGTGGSDRSIIVNGTASILDIGTTLSDSSFFGNEANIGISYGFHGLKVSGCTSFDGWNLGNVTEVPTWINNGGAVSATSFDSVASWDNAGTQFIETIKPNQDAAALAAGHVAGQLHPTADQTPTGTSSKRWTFTGDKASIQTDAKAAAEYDHDIVGDSSVMTTPIGAATGSLQLGYSYLSPYLVSNAHLLGMMWQDGSSIGATESIAVTTSSDIVTFDGGGSQDTESLRPGMLCVISGLYTDVNSVCAVHSVLSSTTFKVRRLHFYDPITFNTDDSGSISFILGPTLGLHNGSRFISAMFPGGVDGRGSVAFTVNSADANCRGWEVRGEDDAVVCEINRYGYLVNANTPIAIHLGPCDGFGAYVLGAGGEYVYTTSASSHQVFPLDGKVPHGATISEVEIDWTPTDASDRAYLEKRPIDGSTSATNILSLTPGGLSSRVLESMGTPAEVIDRSAYTYQLRVATGTGTNLTVYGFVVSFASSPHVEAV